MYTVLKRPDPGPPLIIITPKPLPTDQAPASTPSTLNVYVSGAVHQPDVYALPPGSLVKDAIAAAGGATPEADLDRINLALRLTDQMQVYVPRKGESLPAGKTPTPAITGPININTASAEELDTLPGIGPSLAQAIIDYRTQHGLFKTIDELNDVKGIGDALLAKLRDRITVGP
jgi:competence protein ComEA